MSDDDAAMPETVLSAPMPTREALEAAAYWLQEAIISNDSHNEMAMLQEVAQWLREQAKNYPTISVGGTEET